MIREKEKIGGNISKGNQWVLENEGFLPGIGWKKPPLLIHLFAMALIRLKGPIIYIWSRHNEINLILEVS